VASHDEEFPNVRENSSVLIDHSPQAIPAEEDKQSEPSSISPERADKVSFKDSK
jgi:hypothetical protein